jgi:hypothetical protein
MAVAQHRPDFSGTWDMDVSRSESAHQDVPIGPESIVIHQTAADISIETRRNNGSSSEKLVFQLDGAERTNITDGGQEIKVKAHWDALKLVTETERELNGSTVTTRQVFTLAPTGREVTVDKTLTVQHGYQSPGSPKTTGKGRDVFVRARP